MKTIHALLVACVLAIFSVSAIHAAEISGTINLKNIEKRPKPKARYTKSASNEVKKLPPPVAVIYLEGDFTDLIESGDLPEAILAQKHFQFTPNVLPILVGTTVSFPNLDSRYHNVFSYSKVKSFDLGRYSKDDEPQKETFDKPGEVKVFCEIHDHMRSTILILETPFFTSNDATGAYTLKDIPEGEYTLKCWYSSSQIEEKKIQVKKDETLVVNFE